MIDFWESGLKQIKNCDKSPDTITIWLKMKVKRKIDILMDKYKSREWLAYLLGKDNIVDDIYFPKQNATAGTVDNIELPAEIKVMGVIHSHHGMGTFFSGTDDSFINGNHDISIVVAHNGFKGTVRWKTPCGCLKEVDAKIKLYVKTSFNEDEFIKDVEEKMKYEVPVVNYPRYGNGYYYAEGYEKYVKNSVKDDEDGKEEHIPSLRQALSDIN